MAVEAFGDGFGCPPLRSEAATRATLATVGTCTALIEVPVLARATLGTAELAATEGRSSPRDLAAPALATTWAEPTANSAAPAAAVVLAVGAAEVLERTTAAPAEASMLLGAVVPVAAGATFVCSTLATMLDGRLTPVFRFVNVLGLDAAGESADGWRLDAAARLAIVVGSWDERLMAGIDRPGARGEACVGVAWAFVIAVALGLADSLGELGVAAVALATVGLLTAEGSIWGRAIWRRAVRAGEVDCGIGDGLDVLGARLG